MIKKYTADIKRDRTKDDSWRCPKLRTFLIPHSKISIPTGRIVPPISWQKNWSSDWQAYLYEWSNCVQNASKRAKIWKYIYLIFFAITEPLVYAGDNKIILWNHFIPKEDTLASYSTTFNHIPHESIHFQ